ncbi:MAG TPA: hypothetical protein H9759_00175 [Candidatus Dietzia intestinipullorum]|nr:hypothetical protein [Candidatus Dietzia intestinipullorum]
MSQRLTLEERERDLPDPAPLAAGVADGTEAAVLPSPVTTAAAICGGGAIGFATVYGLVALHVNPLLGVAVIVALYAVAMGGLKHLAEARTELGRAFAVSLNALAIGGTLAGLVVLT